MLGVEEVNFLLLLPLFPAYHPLLVSDAQVPSIFHDSTLVPPQTEKAALENLLSSPGLPPPEKRRLLG